MIRVLLVQPVSLLACALGVAFVGAAPAAELLPPQVALIATSAAPKLDGRLDDAVWQRAQWAGNFTLYARYQPATQETRVALAWDTTNLYVAFDCLDAAMERVESFVTTRDGDIYRDNSVELFIAPAAGDAEYAQFATNTLGTQLDVWGAGPEKLDATWNPPWQVATTRQGDRWCAEMAIPWTTLRVAAPQAGLRLGFNAARTAGPSQELSSWVPMSHGFHRPAQFAHAVLTAATTAPSGKLDLLALQRNPPIAQSMTELAATMRLETRIAAAPQAETADLPLVPLTLPPGQPLPAGSYIVSVTWPDETSVAYGQRVGVKIAAPDTRPLVATLRQPFYSTEKTWHCELDVRAAGAGEWDWQLTTGATTQAAGSLRLTVGKTFVEQPWGAAPNGAYTLTINRKNGAETITLPLVKGMAAGVPSVVQLTANGTLLRDGKPYIPLLICLPFDLRECAAQGFNMVLGGIEDVTPTGIADNLKMLDEAHAAGLGVSFHLANLFRGKADLANMRALVSRLKGHPALVMWYLADEPNGTGTSAETLREAARIVHEIDPNHPVAGCENTPVMFSTYAPVFDLFFPDPYPIPDNHLNLVTQWLATARKAQAPGQSLMVILQAQGKPWYTRSPTPDEAWNMAMQSVVAGCKGLGWWAHGPARDDRALWAEYRTLLPYMEMLLKNVVAAQRTDLSVGNLFVARFTGEQGDWLVAVNTDSVPQEMILPAGITAATPFQTTRGAELHQNGTTWILRCQPLGLGAWRLNP